MSAYKKRLKRLRKRDRARARAKPEPAAKPITPEEIRKGLDELLGPLPSPKDPTAALLSGLESAATK